MESHAFQVYLTIEEIEHTKTKTPYPPINRIVERVHKTMKQEFYAVSFKKNIYESVEELHRDVDEWLKYYNNEPPHSGKYCYGKMPKQTFIDLKHIAFEKSKKFV
ncbi:MAG: integrase core domain-containing protein [Holosporales bacterium]|jgi:transposase InsO family protein|nr:integrase core domain-containing protein [Holosporales bacterium]